MTTEKIVKYFGKGMRASMTVSFCFSDDMFTKKDKIMYLPIIEKMVPME